MFEHARAEENAEAAVLAAEGDTHPGREGTEGKKDREGGREEDGRERGRETGGRKRGSW